MQMKSDERISKKEMYSIDQYQGSRKWCFGIVLNKARTNLDQNPLLFEKTLTRFETTHKQDWFDKETKELIYESETEYRVKKHLQEAADERLRNLRNYFSHYFHAPNCLIFATNDPLKVVLEKAYEKARLENVKHWQDDLSIEFPDLFDKDGKITSAGVIFFVSFFVEKRFLNRLMGYVAGFLKTEGEYGITRDVFSAYSLRDSHSVQAQDKDAVMFRDILGYLSRVPIECYQRMDRLQNQKGTQLSERKTDKFISFAINYLEDYGFGDSKGYRGCFARSTIKREERETDNTDDAKHKPHRVKPKVEIHFDRSKDNPLYIKHNNVILQIQKKDGQSNILRMGLYELKYLVLLCLSGKGGEALGRIDNYIHGLKNRLPYTERMNGQEIQKYVKSLPKFMRSHLGILQTQNEKRLKARLNYVKTKWEEKREKSKELELHRKGRDILRYINERCEKPLTIDQYNYILELLVRKDLIGFYGVLQEMKTTRRIQKNLLQALARHNSLNALHEKVCNLVLKELENLEPEKLKEYLGLIPKEEKEVSFQEKIDRIVNQPVIYKGSLREQFFQQDKRSFAKLVEQAMKGKIRGPDVPLGTEYYHIVTLDRFDKVNKTLYETLAMDRLCLMIAREYYFRLNKKFAQKAERIEWSKENGREMLVFVFQHPIQQDQKCSIRFSVRDYTKLYVMDDSKFLARLFIYFFPQNKKTIDYHQLYAEGINKYTNLQKEGIEAIFELEKIIGPKQISAPNSYVEFEEIVSKRGYDKSKQDALRDVRNGLLHYNLDFEKEQLRSFYEVMKQEGIRKRWSLTT